MPSDQPDLDAAVAYLRQYVEIDDVFTPTIKPQITVVLDALDRLRQPAPADDALDAAARELIERRAKAHDFEFAWTQSPFLGYAANHAAAVAQLALDRGAALRAKDARIAAMEKALEQSTCICSTNPCEAADDRCPVHGPNKLESRP